MKHRRSIIVLLIIAFISVEVLFSYANTVSINIEDVAVSFLKVLFFLILILLYTKGIGWAKWMLSVLLVLFGLLYLMGAVFEELWQWYVAGFFYLFFGIYIHQIFIPAPSETSLTSEQQYKYPSLVNRYKALLVDSTFLVIILVTLMIIVENSQHRPTIMITTGLLLFFVYEPFLTCYSQTIGQRIMKIQVRRMGQPDKKINLMNSYIRWITKGLLGWLSFITINFNLEHRAIHDLASDSVMIDVE